MTTPSPHDWNGHDPGPLPPERIDPEQLRRSAQIMLDALTTLAEQAQALLVNIEQHCAERAPV